MSVQKYVLTNTPVKISDGLKKCFAQSEGFANFHFIHSLTAPDKTLYHWGKEISISEGFTIWAWNPTNSPITLTVSTAE